MSYLSHWNISCSSKNGWHAKLLWLYFSMQHCNIEGNVETFIDSKITKASSRNYLNICRNSFKSILFPFPFNFHSIYFDYNVKTYRYLIFSSCIIFFGYRICSAQMFSIKIIMSVLCFAQKFHILFNNSQISRSVAVTF